MTDPTPRAATQSTWHRELIDAAERADRHASKITGDRPDQQRAREFLTTMAQRCRDATQVFELDPTLVDETPHGTGRFRGIDLLMEMARQLGPLLRQACGTPVGTDPDPEHWEIAEALFARAQIIAHAIPRTVPRLDHATEQGSRSISRERLAAQAYSLNEAASAIHAACGSARLNLPHVDPLVDQLTVMAHDLNHHAAKLMAEHSETIDRLATEMLSPGPENPS